MKKRGAQPGEVKDSTTLRFVEQVTEKVSLYLHHKTLYYYRGLWMEDTQKMDIKSLRTKNKPEAVKKCKAIQRLIDAEIQGTLRSIIPLLMLSNTDKGIGQDTIQFALDQGIAARNMIERSRDVMRYHARYFREWVTLNHPGLHFWCEITSAHAEEYAKHLEKIGRKPNTIIKYMQPIAVASRAMHKQNPTIYPIISVGGMITKKQREPLKYLTPEQALKLLDYTHAHLDSRYVMWHKSHVMIGLGCFLGLRPSEMCRLTLDDVNIATKTLTINESKSEAGVRVIPMTDIAVRAWVEFLSHARVRPISDKEPLLKHDYLIMGRFMRQVLRKASVALKDPDYARCAPHEAMRKTFCRMMDTANVPDKYQDAIVGHAPATMRREHYSNVAVDPRDLEHIKTTKLAQLRKHAIEPINALVELSENLSENNANRH